MPQTAPQRFRRADLHLEVLWSDCVRSTSPGFESRVRQDPAKFAFCMALLEYFTHFVPAGDSAYKSLAAECLDRASHSFDAALDEFISLALAPSPAALCWIVYTYRGSVSYVWDPISGPLSNFILASPSLPQLARAARVEGPAPDPEAFRFLLREKLIHRSRSFAVAASCS